VQSTNEITIHEFSSRVAPVGRSVAKLLLKRTAMTLMRMHTVMWKRSSPLREVQLDMGVAA
jgi:hypothetical protein